jgi:DNA-binding XRE family transcriptional regulator
MKHTYVPHMDEIRKLRESIKVSQAVAASMVNATSATWSRYETGKDKMPPERWRLFTFEVGMHATEPLKANGKDAKNTYTAEEQAILTDMMTGWDDVGKVKNEEELEAMRAEQAITDRLREHKEQIIQHIESRNPRLGASAREQFPDREGIPYALVQSHIEKLMPIYKQLKE